MKNSQTTVVVDEVQKNFQVLRVHVDEQDWAVLISTCILTLLLDFLQLVREIYRIISQDLLRNSE